MAKNELILSLVAEAESTIRDAVWGDIALDRKVLQMLDSSSFQRLRRVQQLGFTSWIWPGAHHSRFEHSLGVFHLTRQAVLHLLHRTAYEFTPSEVNTVLASALLHDVGHYPYSHAVEELDLNVIRSHETIGREIVLGSEVGGILRESWGVELLNDLMKSPEWSSTAERTIQVIWYYWFGQGNYLQPGRQIPSDR